MKKVLITLVVLTVVGCERYIEYSPQYDGDKIVMNGFISLENGIEITLSRSFNPFEVINTDDTSQYFNDAIVILKNNEDVIIDTLVNVGTGGRYVFSKNVKLNSNINYIVHAQVKDLEDVETDLLRFEKEIEGLNVQYVDEGEQMSYARIEIPSDKQEGLYLFIQTYGKLDGDIQKIDATIAGISRELDCSEDFFGPKESFVLDINCLFPTGNISFSIDYLKVNYSIIDSLTYLDDFELIISTISKENYDLFRSSYQKQGDFEFGFQEPDLTESNVKNGYGLVIPINEQLFSFP